jgi:hypothetical protein
MTILTENENTFTLTSQAILIEDSRDVASSWASKHITSNPAFKWVLGKYVEADNANSNGQYWTLKDLQLNGPTISHTPMNIGHQAQRIVGSFVASDLIYPEFANSNPYIEALGVMWKYYFPESVRQVEAAFEQGSLFLSMECLGETVTCGGPDGCGETFPYQGPMSNSYCTHIQERASYRQLNNPIFVGGALVVPPFSPGWKGAEVTDVAQERATAIYEDLKKQSPHLSEQSLEATAIYLAAEKQDADILSPQAVAKIVANRISARSGLKIKS